MTDGFNENRRIAAGLAGAIALSRIKQDLPNWPDQVVEQWLLKVANRGPETGWPPPEPLSGPWNYILGERPLSWWNGVTWRLEEHELDIDRLSASTRRIVQEMIDAHVNGATNTYTTLPESKRRFTSALHYTAEHGTMPNAPLAMQMHDGIIVIDGNHRVAALCFCQTRRLEDGVAPQTIHKLWMGAHPTAAA